MSASEYNRLEYASTVRLKLAPVQLYTCGSSSGLCTLTRGHACAVGDCSSVCTTVTFGVRILGFDSVNLPLFCGYLGLPTPAFFSVSNNSLKNDKKKKSEGMLSNRFLVLEWLNSRNCYQNLRWYSKFWTWMYIILDESMFSSTFTKFHLLWWMFFITALKDCFLHCPKKMK